MRLGWKVKMLVALINIIINIIFFFVAIFTNNSFLLGWSIGYSAFSLRLISDLIKQLREMFTNIKISEVKEAK